MKLAKSNAEKLFITRARLWANVYWSITDSSKEANRLILDPTEQADLAVKRFDDRFGHRLSHEEATKPV